jgi:[ribosomal protein S5]-alanine N-acetyltransferase
MISLKTTRLLIRDHIPGDLLPMHTLYSALEEMRFLSDIKTRNIEETKLKLFDAINEANSARRTKYFFAILNHQSYEYIGEIGYTITLQTKQGSRADLGYFIIKKYWNKGYITEAGKAVIKDAFENRNIHKITASCFRDNVASEKVMINIGLIKEAEFKNHAFHENYWKDRLQYGLIKADYERLEY